MSKGQFKFRTRTQFSFRVTDATLSHILMRIAKNKVGIDGYLQTKLRINSRLNLVRLVVGTGTSTIETSHELKVVRSVLRSLGVRFNEKKILQIFGLSPRPGVISTLFGALWCKAGVEAFYLGEKNTLYIDVLNLNRAKRILSQSTLRSCG